MSDPPVTILGVESSCDETAAAVVRNGRATLSNIIATQTELHEEYGGVVPEIASRAHIERILPVIDRAMKDAQVGPDDLDAIAVGHRPGLIGSLLVGVAAAKTLAWAWGKPLIGVDHVIAHLHSGSLDAEPPEFPALGLVVSGGHTNLFVMRSPIDIDALGRTIDDAIGEAYDKAATILGLGFPGGPIVDERAARGDETAHELPISTLDRDSLDFSFSGLKTALLYTVRGTPKKRGKESYYERDHSDLSAAEIDDLCASFQRAAVGAIMLKLRRAFEQLSERDEAPRTLIVGGGVSANSRLRAEVTAFASERGLDLRLPSMAHCLDNAAMIAGLAFHFYKAGRFDELSLTASASASF
ncbi:MAG: tRNA (adenosine(37)-N6)-threonylcarbamoyltransferase complex transferase subunit TsaD [Phycisphaerales bacterium]